MKKLNYALSRAVSGLFSAPAGGDFCGVFAALKLGGSLATPLARL